MNKLPVTVASSVNAGVCLIFPNHEKVWIDFFPSGETRLFSFLKEEEWEKIKKDPVYFPPDLILFTHLHPDHYCSSRAKEMQALLPDVPIILPMDQWPQGKDHVPSNAVLISGHEAKLRLGSLAVRMVSTQHSGQQYISTRHYSIFLTGEDKTIFISGDADFRNSCGLTETLELVHPSLMILTFPWATTVTGRDILEHQIRPEHVLLYHVPNPEEDREGFRDMALASVSQLNVPDCRVLEHTMQVEEFML